jgi:hypothetical protein
VVNITPQPHFTPGKDPVPIVQEAGWAPGPVWTGGKSRPTGIRSPDRPARSQSLYRLSYLAHNVPIIYANFIITVRKKYEVLFSCRPVVLAAECSPRITGYDVQNIPRQSTKCHYMRLRTAFGALQITVGLLGPFFLAKNINSHRHFFCIHVRSRQYSEGPATGHLDTGFSWFPSVYK